MATIIVNTSPLDTATAAEVAALVTSTGKALTRPEDLSAALNNAGTTNALQNAIGFAANKSGAVAAPTSLPPSGAAGGDLTGTYPNPTISAAALAVIVNAVKAQATVIIQDTSGATIGHAFP